MTDIEPKHFSRRGYTVRDERLDKAKRIEVIVRVDGQTLVQVQAREPGMIAFVSRPDDAGFDIEVVEATGVRYTDVRVPSEQGAPLPWQIAALFGPREKP